MRWTAADKMDRTAKILIDSGLVNDPHDAQRYLENLILQVAVGPEIASDPAAQSALATIVNAGRRAYKGGVHVLLEADPVLFTGWTAGSTASSVVTRYGGTVVVELHSDRPTLAIGNPASDFGAPALHLTWDGWTAGLVQQAKDSLGSPGHAVAGVLAAGLGIAETFQQALGSVVAGRRDTGISLWRPDLDWRSPGATGPTLEYLPAAMWLLGLGHLGQANAWTIAMLPYAERARCEISLMDFDTAVDGNTATQLLTDQAAVGIRKTRIVSAALERVGFRTRIVEKAFDDDFKVNVHANPSRDEPLVALAGFDTAKPRRQLGHAGFRHVVDAGLGSGPVEYLDMVLHTFPATIDPAEAFPDPPHRLRELPAAYQAEIGRQVAQGADESAARCGMVDLAGVTVGAAFVGTVASALAVADILRVLHDGQRYSVIALDLREAYRRRAVADASPSTYVPKYTRASSGRDQVP